jgi:hypothetical protein
MAKGLSGDKPEQMAVVNKHYAAHLEKAQVLMDLGEVDIILRICGVL